jgi:hypothetical protein
MATMMPSMIPRREEHTVVDESSRPVGPPFFWCLTHKRVEGREGCPDSVRLGPYDDFASAERAIEHARERSQAWDKDPRWGD